MNKFTDAQIVKYNALVAHKEHYRTQWLAFKMLQDQLKDNEVNYNKLSIVTHCSP
jgi:hypothetical protein